MLLTLLAAGLGAPLSADEPAPAPLAAETAANKLLAATVTLRVMPGDAPRPADAPPSGVTVCSAVSLGNGLLVTFVGAPADARLRVTLPDGRQDEARLRVTDHYSGLSLLEISRRDLAALDPAERLPPVGSAVLTAAAAGLDKPLVSLGILSGLDRTLPQTGLPPLVQCDVRTTKTSSGAALVDLQGRLLGVIAATESADQRGGWSFAVPVRHVERLLRARVEDRLVVLQRQRPSVGLTLGPGADEGTVVVERIVDDGPAAQAGLRPGDTVLEADDRPIRSAYQAVDLVLKKQPGDPFAFLIQRDGTTQRVEVTLGGGRSVPEPQRNPAALGGLRIGPQLNVRLLGTEQVEVRDPSRDHAHEVAVDPQPDSRRLPRDELTLLRVQLEAFEKVIQRLQEELQRRDEIHQATQQRLKSLTDELERLRQQLGPR